MITLVLLPGMDGTGQLFDPFIAALGQEFDLKVVRYPTTEALGYSELEAVARSALPAEQPFVLLGESFSGPIAISIAASAPRNLQGLILCCTFARNPRPFFSALRPVIGLVPVDIAPMRVLNHLLLGSFSTSALQAALAKSLAQVSASALRARLAAVLDVDVSAKLPAIKVPTLYLRASRDRLVPRSAAEPVAQFVPGVRITELDAPHFLLQAIPAESAQMIRLFVHEVAAQQH